MQRFLCNQVVVLKTFGPQASCHGIHGVGMLGWTNFDVMGVLFAVGVIVSIISY